MRTRLDRINRAAGYLQGYLRMKWLTKYFKMMKSSALKIQKFARKYLFRKKIIEEREEGFYSKPGNEVNVLRGVENNVIFGQKKAIQAIDPEKLPVTLSWFKKKQKFESKIPDLKTFIPSKILFFFNRIFKNCPILSRIQKCVYSLF